jgi:hypothetical protein
MKLFITVLFLSVEFILVGNAQAHIQGYKLDDAKCNAAWAAAGPKDNTISYGQAASYVVDANIVDMEGDGSISFEEFKTACADGLMLSPDLPPTKGPEVGKASNMPGPAAAMPPGSPQLQNRPSPEAKGEDPEWKRVKLSRKMEARNVENAKISATARSSVGLVLSPTRQMEFVQAPNEALALLCVPRTSSAVIS